MIYTVRGKKKKKSAYNSVFAFLHSAPFSEAGMDDRNVCNAPVIGTALFCMFLALFCVEFARVYVNACVCVWS